MSLSSSRYSKPAPVVLLHGGLVNGPASFLATSENESERELDRPRSAELIEGIESSALQIPAREPSPEHLRGLAEFRKVHRELGKGQQRIGRGKVGMIHCVEQFRPELESEQLMDGKVAVHTKVPLRSAK